ncbi:3-oxoacyl-[acyl-carrier-protein] synthase III [Pseudoscourfieldia marina]
MRILGSGVGLPKREVSNHELLNSFVKLDISDEWIKKRTGISKRYIMGPDETAVDFAVEACEGCLKSARVSKETVDLLIYCASMPDDMMGDAARIASKVAPSAWAFDVRAACNGFVVGLVAAYTYLRSFPQQYKRAMIVALDCATRLVDWQDRNTCFLFGDGAGALLVELSDRPFEHIMRCRGSQALKQQFNPKTRRFCDMQMNGREVYNFAIDEMPTAIRDILKKRSMNVNDVDHFLLHQANARILEHIQNELGIPDTKMPQVVEQYGNTGAASIPILLNTLLQKQRINTGDTLLLGGYGGGLSWGVVLMEVDIVVDRQNILKDALYVMRWFPQPLISTAFPIEYDLIISDQSALVTHSPSRSTFDDMIWRIKLPEVKCVLVYTPSYECVKQMFHAFQAIKQVERKLRHVCIITCNAFSISGNEKVNPHHFSVVAMVRNLIRTVHETHWCLIDLTEAEFIDGLNVAHTESTMKAFTRYKEVAWRRGRRFTSSMDRCVLPVQRPRSRISGTFVVTGGLGALGSKTARWLALKGAHCVILIGRSLKHSQRVIDFIQRDIAVDVEVRSVDLADYDAVEDVLCYAQRKGDLNGIIHAAGVMEGVSLNSETWRMFEDKVKAKAHGCDNLIEACRRNSIYLQHLVVFSSASVQIPVGPRYLAYVASNAYITALARNGNSEVAAYFSAIHWGMISSGMTETYSKCQRKALDDAGIGFIDYDSDGVEVLHRCFTTHVPGLIVSPTDWQKYYKYEEDALPAFAQYTKDQVSRHLLSDDATLVPKAAGAKLVTKIGVHMLTKSCMTCPALRADHRNAHLDHSENCDIIRLMKYMKSSIKLDPLRNGLEQSKKIMQDVSDIAILGAGAQGRQVAYVTTQAGMSIQSIFDTNPKPEQMLFGMNVLKGTPSSQIPCIIGIGNNQTRKTLSSTHGHLSYATIIHPDTSFGENVTIGHGTYCEAMIAVYDNVVLGRHCCINYACHIGRNVTIEDFCFIGAGSMIGDNCRVEQGAMIGMGATIAPGKIVGSWSTIMVGSVVLSDVQAMTIVCGNPAQTIRNRQQIHRINSSYETYEHPTRVDYTALERTLDVKLGEASATATLEEMGVDSLRYGAVEAQARHCGR